MRIVHIMLSKNFSGAERHVVELTEAQAQAEHEVHVILHAKGFGQRDNAIAHRFSDAVTIHKVGLPIRQWTFAQVKRKLKQLNPDIVHCHLKAAAKSIKGLQSGAKTVATLHIDYDPKQHDHMDALIAITPHQLSRVKSNTIVRCQQIDNWVTGECATPGEALAVRKEHGIADDDILIGTIGRVESTKQHGLLIQAVKPLLGDKVKLAIIGQGRLYADLKAAHPDVLMPGYSNQAKAWMRGFDIFVSAADYEPFGLVFLEALQAKTPVVATASEGAQHLAEQLQLTPVPVNDVAALRAAIEVELSQAPRRAGYNCDSFRVEEKSDQVLALYKQLMA